MFAAGVGAERVLAVELGNAQLAIKRRHDVGVAVPDALRLEDLQRLELRLLVLRKRSNTGHFLRSKRRLRVLQCVVTTQRLQLRERALAQLTRKRRRLHFCRLLPSNVPVLRLVLAELQFTLFRFGFPLRHRRGFSGDKRFLVNAFHVNLHVRAKQWFLAHAALHEVSRITPDVVDDGFVLNAALQRHEGPFAPVPTTLVRRKVGVLFRVKFPQMVREGLFARQLFATHWAGRPRNSPFTLGLAVHAIVDDRTVHVVSWSNGCRGRGSRHCVRRIDTPLLNTGDGRNVIDLTKT